MPTQTRLQARSAQTADQVTSPRANRPSNPRRILRSRQGNAGVVVNSGEGGPSFIAAVGTVSENGLTFGSCKDKRCKTCPTFVKSNYFKSNVTNVQYNVKNHTGEVLTCHCQNVIYLLTCLGCGVQYVGETILPFHKRNNIHRTEMNAHFEFHLETSCKNYSYSYQIIENLPGNGYKSDGSIDVEMSKVRKDKEDIWIRKMRTLFPYGLCEKARNKVNNCAVVHEAVGKSYQGYPIPRTGVRPTRNRENRNHRDSVIMCENFFASLEDIFQNDLKNSFNRIRILLNTAKKKVLKEIAFYILNRTVYTFHAEREQWYLYILDIINTKLLKPTPIPSSKSAPENVCSIRFINKGMEEIKISEIFRHTDSISSLPDSLQSKEDNPKVVMKLDSPIRNKIMNYDETVRSIQHMTEGEISMTLNSESKSFFPCSCSESMYSDPHHGHVVTGDLRIIENAKLRKLFSKGPNYRENKTINYHKCMNEIVKSLDACASNMAAKYKLEVQEFDSWKSKVKEKVTEKIRKLKLTRRPQQTKPILKDENALLYLQDLQSKYVIVPIDKAANNISIICKRFYVLRLLKEVGALGNADPTYEISDINPSDLINDDVALCERFGLPLDEEQKTLPIMYWTPKMHYTPSRARFIVSSAKCSTKPISRVVSNAFKLIFNQIQNFHDMSKFYKNYNRFWVINNSKPLIERLDVINTRKKAKDISTYDFSTLYTKLPHNDLIRVLNTHIDFVFDGGTSKYLGFSESKVFWKRKPTRKQTISRFQLKALVKHLITRTYFIVGNLIIRQSIGIPMGIDPAPFWANLYLYHYEQEFITRLMRTDKKRARKFVNACRFIDDECNINDHGEFSRSFQEIYPEELQLKCEHQGLHATFLDLDIQIVDGIFVYKLFDKRDEFPFSIVRMPDLSGNLPAFIFYGSIMSEFLRIARCTRLIEDFIPRAKMLCERMVSQGGSKNAVLKQVRKAIERHPIPFSKYSVPTSEIIRLLS